MRRRSSLSDFCGGVIVVTKRQRFRGDPVALREWQARLGLTFDSAAALLDIGRTTYAEMLSGVTRIDLRTALACKAVELGIEPLRAVANSKFKGS